MNVIDQARQAYAPNQYPLRTPRSVEAELFGQITSRLKKCAKAESTYPELVAALHDNRRLWTALAADVSDSLNSLPASLRAQIFYLSEFTESHSKMVMKSEASIEVLIEINTAVLRGLNSRGEP